MNNKLAIVVLAVILVTSFASLYFFENIYHSTADYTVQTDINHNLRLSLTLNANTITYKQGSEIYVTVALTNIGHEALNVSLDPVSYLGFEVKDSKNITVMAADGGNPGVYTLAPQTSVDGTFSWNTGQYRYTPPAAIGVYKLIGVLDEDNFTSSFQTAPLSITIVKNS